MMRITSQNFDDRARSYVAAKKRKESGEQEMKDLKPAFLAFLRNHGKFTGKKSMQFVSELYDAMATFGQTTETDAEVIDRFRRLFNRRPRKVGFREIFEERTTYVVMPTALEAVRTLPKQLQTLFERVQKVEPKAPTLSVKYAATNQTDEVIERRPPRSFRSDREVSAAV
jgi:hypothetical protein